MLRFLRNVEAKTATAPNGQIRRETLTTMMRETLKLANYSAIPQGLCVVAVGYTNWDVAPRGYLLALNAFILALCAATVLGSRVFGHVFDGLPSAGTVRRGFTASRLIALGLGCAWATLPIMLLGDLDNAYRVGVVAVSTGLLAVTLALGPILSVALLFSVPQVIGLFAGLQQCPAPVGPFVSLLLMVYASFLIYMVRRMSHLSYQRIRDSAMVEQQSETIGLLLNEFEEGASDWLWETDADGRLSHVPVRMAALVGLDPQDMQSVPLHEILRRHADDQPNLEAIAALEAAIAERQPFHERIVRLNPRGSNLWLSLNGKPSYDRTGAFAGYRGVGSDITVSREAQARIAFLAGHDTLTGLPNRAAFQESLSSLCREVRAADARGVLFYLDLDGFKAVNDTRGHMTGDRLLKAVGERLVSLVGPADEVFRLGGDEFALLLRNAGSPEAEALARRIVENVRRPFCVDDVLIEIGVSVGIASVPDHGDDPATLLVRADLALYEAKAEGKGRWRFFDPSQEERNRRHRQLDADMRAGLPAGELELHYQPLVDMRSERVVGFEALLRWNKPGEGWISPVEIVPIAESTGFIVEIGRWALRRACLDALTMPDHHRFAVNISSMHVRMPSFRDDVLSVLAETGIRPDRLEIEITETVVLNRDTEVTENLKVLRERGVRIALDDFGTGYSSLSYLTEFPFDKVKVDRSFVRDMDKRPEKVAIVAAIAQMAKALSMTVTVEGVETREQLDVLRAKDCDIAQGFLFSPAKPLSELRALVSRIDGAAPAHAKAA